LACAVFYGATSFNQDISGLDMSAVVVGATGGSARSLPHLQLRASRSHAPHIETERAHIIVWLAWRVQCLLDQQ
jgi:hypothetical protein